MRISEPRPWEVGRTLFEVPGFDLTVRPLIRADVDDEVLIERLGRWRERRMHVYPTQFTVTREGTTRWLQERVLGVPERLMLLVVHPRVGPVGHLGLTDIHNSDRCATLSNVLVGEREAMPRGAMTAALRSMLAWAYHTLGLQAVQAPVFADNDQTLGLLRKVGFAEVGRTPARRHVRPDNRVDFTPRVDADLAPADRWWIQLRHTR